MSAAAVESAVDLVNAALLGTDRRPVPLPSGTDPAKWLLEAAARQRSATLVAGPSTVVLLGPPAPRDTRPAAPRAARALLDELLESSSNVLLNLWLREALDAGTGLAPEHWTPLLDRARRATDLDRRRLGAALGPRGLWFARHNPAWSAVVRATDTSATVGPEPGAVTLSQDGTREALRSLAAGTHEVNAARGLGQRVGARLPLTAYPLLAKETPAPSNRSARAGLRAAEDVLWARWGLAHAFDPTRVPPERHPVPEEIR